MKNLMIFGMFILTMVFAQFAQAQTADDVVNKYIDALGGKEKLSSLNSVRLSGSMSIQGNDIAITVTKLHMKGMRMDISVMGTENYQIITPGKGVMFMPVQGMASPTDMPEDAVKAAQSQLDVQSALLNYKDKGTAVEFLGAEGNDYKLKVTFKNGISTTYFIGKSDNRLNKSVSKRSINGEEMEIETTYSNYKQVDGFWFAFTVTSSVQGETNYDKIETNVKVDESIFK
ncbi:MAG TPA: hypothetical protein PLZ45_10655 [Ferruginibacter sp.]|nr:hypothetical protein [Chitinophagaceae bacterium]HRI25129.1 hypothetical protein [Ferruginibacter sp.]